MLIKENIAPFKYANRIVLDGVTYERLLISADDLYEVISNLLLNTENLYYFCTQKSSCNTLRDTKKFVKQLTKKGILHENLESILIGMKWDKNSININSTTFSGDLGEYLMNILIEKMDISKTLISKVSLKTSPSMPSFGNDNIFFDVKTKTLYFGEAKFYDNTAKALLEAFSSINMHMKNSVELSYITTHTKTFIAENGRTLNKIRKELEILPISQINVSSITFVISQDCYESDNYLKLLNTMMKNGSISNEYVEESIMVFLPIISKNDFLNYFEKKVKML